MKRPLNNKFVSEQIRRRLWKMRLEPYNNLLLKLLFKSELQLFIIHAS